jgi:hypothetical protein
MRTGPSSAMRTGASRVRNAHRIGVNSRVRNAHRIGVNSRVRNAHRIGVNSRVRNAHRCAMRTLQNQCAPPAPAPAFTFLKPKMAIPLNSKAMPTK